MYDINFACLIAYVLSLSEILDGYVKVYERLLQGKKLILRLIKILAVVQ